MSGDQRIWYARNTSELRWSGPDYELKLWRICKVTGWTEISHFDVNRSRRYQQVGVDARREECGTAYGCRHLRIQEDKNSSGRKFVDVSDENISRKRDRFNEVAPLHCDLQIRGGCRTRRNL